MTSQRDRIQSLESRIEELEATVRGLTEELVDANQRIRDLEEAADADEVPDAEPSAVSAPTEDEGDKNDESERANETDDEGGSELGDDIIVA